MKKQVSPVLIILVILALIVAVGIIWKLTSGGKKSETIDAKSQQYTPPPGSGNSSQPANRNMGYGRPGRR